MKKILMLAWIFFALASCTASHAPSTPVIVPTDQTNLPNPASVYCEEQGHQLEIRAAPDGSQNGVCIFPDGSECDEWAYFRGECGPTVPPSTPQFVKEPLAMLTANTPLPLAVLINTGDQRGITAYDPSGIALGEWQTASMTGKVHAAGSITDGATSTPLVFWQIGTEDSSLRLNVNLGGNITPLIEPAKAITFTDMVGLPASPVIAYSTLQYEESGAVIRSKVYLGEYYSLASASPILTIDSRESQYVTPLAIRAEDQTPVGIWFTYHLFGIGGTPALFTNNSGLYYFDIPSNTIYEFIAADQLFNSLSTNQAYAAWVNPTTGDMQVTDLINGQTISFPKRSESERNSGLGMISPAGGYVAWEEGTNLIPGENTPVFTVRIGTMEGKIIFEYPHANFAKTSELGMETSIKLLGWLSDEILLVGVRQLGKEGEEAIVAVNINANEVTLFARGEFVGFAYP